MTGAEAPTPNGELFVQVFAQIEREPKTWNQCDFGSYEDCGTPRCFAGWAVVLSDPAALEDLSKRIPEVAETVLGITGHYDLDTNTIADPSLFHPCNSLADLYRISAGILGLDETVLREKVAAAVADGATQ